jgi:hypothetical protein
MDSISGDKSMMMNAARLEDISAVARQAEWTDFLTSFSTPNGSDQLSQRVNGALGLAAACYSRLGAPGRYR